MLALLAPANLPAAPSSSGAISIALRARMQAFPADPNSWQEVNFTAPIIPQHTAIIITDMWDQHWCHGATHRVGLIAEKMEPVLQAARRAGILIIHAPSDTMDVYANTPGRIAAQNAPAVDTPTELKLPDGTLPIDDRDGGCDTPGDKEHRAWKSEISTLKIAPGDVISDNGREIYNVLRARHIDTILYMGVHANMCILNRTFGMRQMSKWGMRCILVRDLTDAMYNPASRPFVSHAAGTEMVIEFIEQYWGPTTTSAELHKALESHPISR